MSRRGKTTDTEGKKLSRTEGIEELGRNENNRYEISFWVMKIILKLE